MDFSRAYFNKPLDDLVYDDIVNYFVDSKQETETIEFKSYHARSTFDTGLQGVIRGISAFLNSSGGILIWGAPSGQKVQGNVEDVFVGNLSPISELHGKDRLINRISSAIVPLPIGVKVNILESDGSYVYVFEVQPSIYKPHQYDTRYYVRLDGQTKPAPHYLVDALMKQVTYPNLNGIIKFNPMTIDNAAAYHLPITIGIFNFSELQNEELVSFRLLCVGGYFQRGRTMQLAQNRPHAQYNMAGQQLLFESFANVLHFGTPNVHDDHIVIDHDSRQANNSVLWLLLSFGGKKSPAKTSLYTLNFGRHKVNLSSPELLITERKENVLLAEYQQSLNTTPQDSINEFLNRP
jgi:hypothetical protein